MANVLSNLAADIYKAADVVGRELVGFIPSITINAGGERAALNDIVRSHFTRAATVITPSPSMTIPEGTDQAVDNKTLIVDTPLSVQIPWTGEDIKHVNNGSGFETIYGDQVKRAMRAIANRIEAAIALAAKNAASRAWGAAGTTPFAANFGEIPQVRKILADNGCPFDGEMSLVLDTTAGANLRSLAQLQKVNEAGGSELLRQGELLNLQGFMLKESAGIVPHARGTGSGSLLNNASGYAAGSTSIAIDTGSGTIVAGDIFTNTQSGRDSNKYVVGGALAGGSLTLNGPGNRVAWADNDTVAAGNGYTPNIAFHKSAIELAMRPMAVPDGGDAAVDAMVVQDPWSGLVFELRAYKGYKKAMFDVSCVIGVKAWKPEFIATLLG